MCCRALNGTTLVVPGGIFRQRPFSVCCRALKATTLVAACGIAVELRPVLRRSQAHNFSYLCMAHLVR